MRPGLLLAAASLLLTAGGPPPAPPAAPDQPPPAAMDGMRLLDQGAYLRGLDKLQSAAATAARPDDIAYEMWSQARPMIGTYAPPPRLTPDQAPLSSESKAKLRRAAAEEAVAAIAKAARATSIVILNEAHHSPRDRAFALQVAKALRPLGYDLLAAETFTNYAPTVAALARERFPRRDTGTYLKEPVFADFVRQALALGYEPLAYEQTGEQRKGGAPGIPGREQAEAENLAALIKAHPGRKLFVYVGFSHAAEAPIDRDGGAIEWMAARLKKMVGVDPLTIEQTSIAEDSLWRGGREAWAVVAPKLRRSSILRVDGRPLALGPYAGAVDLQVVHPRTRFTGGRPEWLAGMGRKPAPIPAGLLPRSSRRLVQAFLAGEPEDAVPVDQVLVEAGRPLPKLMLPTGRIRYAVQDPEIRPAP